VFTAVEKIIWKNHHAKTPFLILCRLGIKRYIKQFKQTCKRK